VLCCFTLQEHDWVLLRGDGWFANAYKSGVSMVAPSRDGDGGTEMADMEGGMGHRSQHMLVCAPLRGRVDSTRGYLSVGGSTLISVHGLRWSDYRGRL